MIEQREVVLFAGRPGSGKSTLARAIGDSLTSVGGEGVFEHLSIGDHLRLLGRGVIQSAYSTDILEHAKALNKSKRLPAGIVRNVVREYIQSRNEKTKYIFMDGYPRYQDEVLPFIKIVNQSSAQVSSLIHLDLPYGLARERILNRGRREHEREVDEDFADWRLSQHDSTYSGALSKIVKAGVPTYSLDATKPLDVLVQEGLEILNA